MDKLNFVFLIRDDHFWEQLFSHILNLNKQPEKIDKIAVVVIGTGLLSCLRSTKLEPIKSAISQLSNENVNFYLCINTLSKYGIQENMILQEIDIAREGGLMKVADFESKGYHTIVLG